MLRNCSNNEWSSYDYMYIYITGYCTCVNAPFFIKRIEKKERCERCARHKERRKTRNRFYGCSIIQLDRRRTTHSCSEAQPSASSIKSCLPLTECKIEFYFATELFRGYFSFLSKKGKEKEEGEIWLSCVSIRNSTSNIFANMGEKWGKREAYEARVWIWWKHGLHADSARLSRRWELTAELAALMDLTRLNYRPFRRRQYARKGAMDRPSKRTDDSNVMDRSRREKFRSDAVDNWTNWSKIRLEKNFTFRRISIAKKSSSSDPNRWQYEYERHSTREY